jgi:anaerobic selenocysteine-containing dehydrogenase
MIGYPDKRMQLAHPEVVDELRQVRSEFWSDDAGYNADEKYAFRMITYRIDDVYCTQGQNMPSLRKRAPYNPVVMNPEDLEALNLGEGDSVIVKNSFGELEGLVASGKDLPRGVIGIAHGWGDPSEPGGPREKGINVQRLIDDNRDFDPITGLAQQSAVPVNVIRAA